MSGLSHQQIVAKQIIHGLHRLGERVFMNDVQYFPGLEGVIAGETAISTVGGGAGLRYRGYPIEQLAQDGTFLEIAYLLLHGELPNQEQLADFQTIVSDASTVDPSILEFLGELPLHTPGMDSLRTAISAVGNFDPQVEETGRDANIAKATRLLAQIPALIAARYRKSRGKDLIPPNPGFSFAGNLLYTITGNEPSPLHERAMDVSLTLYAEHEFNASTFTSRVVASTGSDMYSAVTAGVGALKGPLHGGANERVMEILDEVGSPANAQEWVDNALAEKRRIMGFGHRVYKTGDPRAVILREYCRELAEDCGNTDLEEIADTIERVVREEKGLPPNLDWPSARLYHYLGLEVELYTPLFVASRVTGWAAHVIEQSENNRLIRPRSQYIGPELRDFQPLSKRG